VARGLVRGGLTTFARFAVMHGTVSGPATAEQRKVFDALHQGYHMTQHTRADSPQAELLTPAFIDRYAVVGPPEACVSRLRELVALGLDKFVVIGPTAGADRDAAREAEQCFAAEVLPAFASA
jgi:5,10-methylenetetrahydromethanopterin reductase